MVSFLVRLMTAWLLCASSYLMKCTSINKKCGKRVIDRTPYTHTSLTLERP